MQVAIIADLHDNLDNWQKIKQICDQQKIDQLIIAGDIAKLETLDKVTKDFPGQIHTVFGNMDQHTDMMKMTADRFDNLNIYDWNGEFTIDNKKFFISHYQEEVEERGKQGGYDVLVCGHTHEPKQEQTNKYLLINPGTAGGIFKKASFAFYDTVSNQVKFQNI